MREDAGEGEGEVSASRAHLKHLVSRLNEMFPDEPDNGATESTFLLECSVERFLSRVAAGMQRVERRKFPAAGGYFTLQRQEPRRTSAAATVLELKGLMHEDDGGCILYSGLIVFVIFTDGGSRIMVQARCTHSALAAYYRELLAHIQGDIDAKPRT